MNPRELKRMLKRMGIDVEEIKGVKSVIIVTDDYELLVKDPQVTVMKVQGQKIYQVVGTGEEKVEKGEGVEVTEVEVSEDDVKFVMEQTGASREDALKALKDSGGDIAKAILLLGSKS
jgi:nascent polypeptide-associated complex subunit alpha